MDGSEAKTAPRISRLGNLGDRMSFEVWVGVHRESSRNLVAVASNLDHLSLRVLVGVDEHSCQCKVLENWNS